MSNSSPTDKDPALSKADASPSPSGIAPLLDGAAGSSEPMAFESSDWRAIAADPDRFLDDRVEAFEDIIDSEVGDTPLVRSRNVEREIGLRQVYLKFEGGNPTGTQKDRIAFAQSMDALRRGFECVTLATCGNYGAAMAQSTSLAGLRCVIYIPEGYQTPRLGEMVRMGAEIIRVSGDYEQAVEVSREAADSREYYDANPGGSNTIIQFRAYGGIAYEIYDELRDAPAVITVPVSNGTTLAGIYRGFLSLYRRGKISRMPRIVAGSSYGKNPIVRSFLKGFPKCEDLTPARIRETTVNEPLINWHSIDGDQALEAIRVTKGWAADATDRAMSLCSRLIREKEGLHVLPASTAGLAALLHRHQQEPLPNDRYVVVLTGRRP